MKHILGYQRVGIPELFPHFKDDECNFTPKLVIAELPLILVQTFTYL